MAPALTSERYPDRPARSSPSRRRSATSGRPSSTWWRLAHMTLSERWGDGTGRPSPV